MTNEELMKPRCKVIAPYPDNKDFPVGKIIEFHPWESSSHYWEHALEDCQGKRTWLLDFFLQYPNLFRKMNWAEDRLISTLPGFVFENKETVHNCYWRFSDIPTELVLSKWEPEISRVIKINSVEMQNFLPATAAEYLAALNTTKQQDNG